MPPVATKFPGSQAFYELSTASSENNFSGFFIGLSGGLANGAHSPAFVRKIDADTFELCKITGSQLYFYGSAMATDGVDCLMVCGATGEGGQIYSRIGTTFNRASGSQFGLPGGNYYDYKMADKQPGGNLWAVQNRVYRKVGNSITQLATLSISGAAVCVRFSSDGSKLVILTTAAPYFYVYSVSGETVTFSHSPSLTVNFTPAGMAISPDGVYIAITNNSTTAGVGNFAFVYKFDGSSYVKLTSPFSFAPTDRTSGVAFSPDGLHLVIGAYTTGGSGFGQRAAGVYKRDGDTFTLQANLPRTYSPYALGIGISYSPDGENLYIAMATSGLGLLQILKRTGDTYVATPVLNNPYGAQFNGSTAYTVEPFSYINTSSGLLPGNYDVPTNIALAANDPIKVDTTSAESSVKIISSSANTPYDSQDGGAVTVGGTVKKYANAGNQPLSRKVRLYHERDRRFIRETWSDPVTGEFSFANLKAGEKYTAMAYDHLGQYRALVLDRVTGV